MNVIPQRVKDGFVVLLAPVARVLIRGGVHPNVITTVGTLVFIGAGVAFAYGAIRWGGVLLLLSGLLDLLDGQVARSGGMTTAFGAFYDSTLDRVGEGALYTGLILYFLHGPLALGLVAPAVIAGLVALVASLLVSYTRARAEALGVDCRVGLGAVPAPVTAGVETGRRARALRLGSLSQMAAIRLGKRSERRAPKIKDFVPLADLQVLGLAAGDPIRDDASSGGLQGGIV